MLSYAVESRLHHTADDETLPGGNMIRQWWTQQSENLGNWLYRKRLAAMQRRIRKQKALLNGSGQITADEMHALRSEVLRDIKGHVTPDHSMSNIAK